MQLRLVLMTIWGTSPKPSPTSQTTSQHPLQGISEGARQWHDSAQVQEQAPELIQGAC